MFIVSQFHEYGRMTMISIFISYIHKYHHSLEIALLSTLG